MSNTKTDEKIIKENNVEEVEELEEEQEYVVLDFDGEEVECAIIDEFELNGKQYIVLYPEDEEDAYIYSYEEDEEGEITLNNLEDEEFEKAVALYRERNKIDV